MEHNCYNQFVSYIVSNNGMESFVK